MHLSVEYKRKKLAKLRFFLLLITIVSLSLSVNADATSVETPNLTPPLDVLWEYTFDGACNAIVASNDSVYVASNQIYAFDADTGRIVWSYDIVGPCPFHEKLIYHSNETIYTGNASTVYAFNSTNGALKWFNHVNGSLYKLFVKNDVLYAVTLNPALLYALNPNTGKEIWEYNTGFSSVSLQIHNKIISLRASTSKEHPWNPYWKTSIHVINTSTGEQLWKWENESIAFNDILLSNETTLIVIAFLNNTKAITFQPFKIIYSINASNAETNWEFKIPNLRSQIVDKNSVYIPFHDKLESLDVITGKLKWEFGVQEPKDVDIKNGSVYVCSADKLYSLNSTTGRLNWIFTIQDTYKIFNTTSIRIEDKRCDAFRVYFLGSTVYLFSNNNYLYRLNPSGKLNWGIQLKEYPSKFNFVSHNGTLYTLSHDILDMIDLKNGTLLQEINIDAYSLGFTKNTIFLRAHRKIIVLSSEKMVAPHAIKVAQSAIDASKDNINVTGAHELLERAKESLTKGDYSNATKYANKAKESAILPFITSAESSINLCNFLHADASKVENLLENAKTAYINRDFSNAVNQAIEAKGCADEAMKTRLMHCILILLISVFAIILLYRFGLLKGVIAFIKIYPLTFILSFIVSFSIVIYLLFSALDLGLLVKQHVLTVGLISIFLFSAIFFYRLVYYEQHFINYIQSLVFSLLLLVFICYLGYMLSFFVVMMYLQRSGEGLSVDLMPITSNLGDIFLNIFRYAAVIIVSVLLAYLVYQFTKYKELMDLDEKANKHEKQGDYEKAIEYVNNELSILDKMTGFFVKIDPFYKGSIQSCHSALSKWYYMLGDYDNTVKNLRKVRKLDNETVDSIYRGEADISGLINEVIKPQAFENNFFKKYLKIKGFIKKPTTLKKIKFEHILIAGLTFVFGFYVFTLLTSDYTDILIVHQNYPKINQLFTWLGFCSLFIFSLVLLLFTTLKIEKGYSKNIFDLFNQAQSEDILSKEQKLKSTYKLLCFSLVLICLLYAIQSTNWFVLGMLYLSKLGMHFVFINIGVPIILFVYAILILSVVKDFTIGISDLTETHHRSDTPQFFRFFPFLLIVSCLVVFTVILTIFLTSLEGKIYDFQQVLPPFIIATSCFIFSINIIYQEFNTGSNKLIGDIYYSKEKYKEACDRYKKIEKHVNNKFYKTVFPPSDTFLSNLYMAYGDSKSRLGEREEALMLFNKSLEFAEKGNLTSHLWQIHYKIGQIKEEGNKLEEAYESYKKSIEIIEDLRELVKIPERKEAFFENKAEVYAKMVVLCLRLGKDEDAFNYAERAKGRVFLELLGTEKVELKARHELKEKEEELLRKIREIEAKLRERREERYFRELSKVMEEYDELLLKIKEDDPEYYSLRKVEPQALKETQSLLTENELILEFFVGDEVIAFIIQKDGMSVEKIPITKKELEAKINDIRKKIDPLQMLSVPEPECMLSVKKVANELYQILIRKLEPMLTGKDLIIVPHGILHYLPFNALYDGESWFVEKYNARFLQNASMRRFLKEKRKEMIRNVLVVGNPTKDLEYAEKEAIDVAHKFNVNPLLGDEAKKEVVIESSINKDLLHLSCHAMFEVGFPRFSRLMLADDNLLVTEVYNLDLNADLVTLSACETGLGGLTNGDEVEGLTRAFMRAGTPSVIASLWKVDAESTSELFLKFYEGEGDKVKRLRDAQIEIMKKYGHPFYWAGFVMFGEG